MAPTMGISWRKKLNPEAIPTIFERPEPTDTSSVASDSGDAATFSQNLRREQRLRLVTALLSVIANRNDQITISQSPIERVSSFRYLGIILSSSLSWSPHISFVCNKSRKILGLLFRHFSPHSSPSTLIRLYISLVRPILEYGSIIWDPSYPTLSHSLDSVQFFALKIASKFRSSLIPIILSEFNLPSLASRRQKAKLIFLFKLYHHLIYFPSQIIYPSLPLSSYPLRSFHPNNLICPFTRKSSFYNSYLPSTVRHWNSLPSPLKETNSLFLFISLLSKL